MGSESVPFRALRTVLEHSVMFNPKIRADTCLSVVDTILYFPPRLDPERVILPPSASL